MHMSLPNIAKFNILCLTTSCLVVFLVLLSPLTLYALESRVDFYSIASPPSGVTSLEPLLGKWWNWWMNHSANMANNWPPCFKGDGGPIAGNKSVVFTANPASAVESDTNSRNQNCEIKSNDLLYLPVYPGECSTGLKPHEGEYPDTKSPADLLSCARGSNDGITVMQVKVDGKDVSSHIIRQSTFKPFKFVVPKDNPYNAPSPIAGGNNISMAEIYYLFFKPLPIGEHKIELHVERNPNPPEAHESHNINWNIRVTR